MLKRYSGEEAQPLKYIVKQTNSDYVASEGYFCSKIEFLSSVFLTSKQAKWNPVTEKPMEDPKISTKNQFLVVNTRSHCH